MGGGGGWYINDRARACMHECVCAFMNWFINYVMMESMKYIITSACLSVFLYLPIYIRTHTHTYIYVCVCLDALTLDEEKSFIYLRLSHIKR